ncbi:hypothetical protein B0H11DRAFT_2024078 [Mycena galericulata]|nr:hypothetical protein B0H11DRAFT_2024078 [Mycena galericulata]
MSISLYKRIGRYQDIKWIPLMPEPNNSSLVSAVLPDDLIIPIVEDAACDIPTALSLAFVSKAVGRMAESILYTSVTLRSIHSARIFTTTLRTKSRRLLSGVVHLTLTLPAPRDFEDFWALVGKRCPNIEQLSLLAEDLDCVRPTQLRPRHLRISYRNIPRNLPAHIPCNAPDELTAPWGRVTHLSLPDRHPGPLSTVNAVHLRHLTHFSFFLTSDVYLHNHTLLALPSLRVCVIQAPIYQDAPFAIMWQNLSQIADDRRVVVVWDATPNGEGPDWESAEREIASRAGRQ